jgi:hypothetical protein
MTTVRPKTMLIGMPAISFVGALAIATTKKY